MRPSGGLTTQRSEQYVAFTLDEYPFCLYLSQVERVVFIGEVTPLPQAPEIVLGVINLSGDIIPVVNVRKRFRLPHKEIDLSDQLIVTHTQKRRVAVLVDTVTGVISSSAARIIPTDQIIPGMEYVSGVIKLNDGMILIHDLETFLSLEEEKGLDSAMSTYRGTHESDKR